MTDTKYIGMDVHKESISIVREIEQLFDERGDLAALFLRKSTSSFDGGGKDFLHQEIGPASLRGF